MNFAQSILKFFNNLKPPQHIPAGVEILWPYSTPEVRRVMQQFYLKFMGDTNRRVFLVGINPGRFGAGATGICFTDPIRLSQTCDVPHSIPGRQELSSDFVYRMIAQFGGPLTFYRHFYITALSPVGFIKDGKNLNYYDIKNLPGLLDDWMAQAMQKQLNASAERRVAYSMGMGSNFRYFKAFNDRHKFFKRVEPLPHPRWIMQYRRKRLDEFINLYIDTLQQHCR